jgi:hypothetical protein
MSLQAGGQKRLRRSPHFMRTFAPCFVRLIVVSDVYLLSEERWTADEDDQWSSEHLAPTGWEESFALCSNPRSLSRSVRCDVAYSVYCVWHF